MGVVLTPIIQNEPIALEALRQKVLAVDGNGELYQFLALIRLRDGSPLRDAHGRVTSHLSGLFFRTTRLIAEHALRPVFVFDGVPPPRKAATLENEEAAVAWFYRMLRNAVIDHHRRRTSADRRLEAFAQEVDIHTEPDVDLRGAICGCVGELAGTLKPEYAAAIQRIDVDGLAVSEYATEAGISSGNAAVRVFRARRALSSFVVDRRQDLYRRWSEGVGTGQRIAAMLASGARGSDCRGRKCGQHPQA